MPQKTPLRRALNPFRKHFKDTEKELFFRVLRNKSTRDYIQQDEHFYVLHSDLEKFRRAVYIIIRERLRNPDSPELAEYGSKPNREIPVSQVFHFYKDLPREEVESRLHETGIYDIIPQAQYQTVLKRIYLALPDNLKQDIPEGKRNYLEERCAPRFINSQQSKNL